MSQFRLWFSAVAFSCFAGSGAQPTEDVYTGVRQERFFANLNLTPKNRVVGRDDVGYDLNERPDFLHLSVGLAVYPTLDEARRMFQGRTGMIPGAPTPFEERVGDECVLWTGAMASTLVHPERHESGTLLIRMQNIVLCFSWLGSVSQGIALAKSSVQLIEGDRQVAPLGTFDETPEIVSVDLAESCEAGQKVELHPRVRGLGDASRVRFAAVARMNILRDTPTPPPPGELKFPVPIEREEGPTKIEIIAVNDDNVFVTKVVTTNVIGGKLLPDPSTFRREKE